MKTFNELDTYKALMEHHSGMKDVQMKDLFSADSSRFEKFNIRFNDILFDYSKNRLNEKTLELLCNLAEEVNLKSAIENIFNGKEINITEKRAVLHTALRNRSNPPVMLDGKNVMDDVNAVLEKMKLFVDKVHSGEWKGFSGKKITDVINIGIGGSDLGPMMVCNSLKPYAVEGMNVHFVSNIDGTHLAEKLKKLNPETSLFIVASKTFTTQETITNATSAKDWFLKESGNNPDYIAKHFIALSTNEKAVAEFGIDTNNMFGFWDWVGGRYSLWSAIGMSIALYLGYDNFISLLQGAHEADLHFKNESFDNNIPILMGLISIWYANFFNTKTYAVIPYDQYMEYFPAFLQQLEMESNGKYVDVNSNEIEYNTGTVLWGEPGTNAQHSFFQLLHQGTQIIPADFIAPAKSHNPISNQHDILMSNFFAQTEALMKGKTEEEVNSELNAQGMNKDEIAKLLPHKVFKGNRPTNSFLLKEISPRTLGTLIAFYEHRVFVQGVIWNINSFDQWGVELGKQLAKKILPELTSDEDVKTHDSSTNGLIGQFKRWTI